MAELRNANEEHAAAQERCRPGELVSMGRRRRRRRDARPVVVHQALVPMRVEDPPIRMDLRSAVRMRGARRRHFTNPVCWRAFFSGRRIVRALRHAPCFRTDHPNCGLGFMLTRGLVGIPQWIFRCLPDPARCFGAMSAQICNLPMNAGQRRLNSLRDGFSAWSLLCSAAVQTGVLTFTDFFRPYSMVLWMAEPEALNNACECLLQTAHHYDLPTTRHTISSYVARMHSIIEQMQAVMTVEERHAFSMGIVVAHQNQRSCRAAYRNEQVRMPAATRARLASNRLTDAACQRIRRVAVERANAIMDRYEAEECDPGNPNPVTGRVRQWHVGRVLQVPPAPGVDIP